MSARPPQCHRGDQLWPLARGGTAFASLCVPKKSGSSAFTQLLFRHSTGQFAQHAPVPWIHQDSQAANFPYANFVCERLGVRPVDARNETYWMPMGSRLIRLLILRDPYERLLSGYLHMVRALAGWNWTKSIKARALLLSPNATSAVATAATFAHFTWQLRGVNATVRTPHWHPFLLEHLLPLTSEWHRARHSCHTRPAAAFDRVLRLDEQAEWYASFVRDLNLSDAAQDTRWRAEQGTSIGCWWSPPGVACADALNVDRSHTNHLAACSAQSASDAGVEQVEHLNGACAKTSSFYSSAATRAAATQFLKDDLAFVARAK